MKLFLVLMIAASLAYGQAAAKANAGYRTKEARAGLAVNLDDPHRAERQKPAEIIAALGIRPGMTVADLGTGTGLMIGPFSAAVGPKGKVIAEDIFEDFLDKAREKAKTLDNVTFVLGTERDPKLPAGAVDLALVMDAYHHFDYPAEMLANIATGLKKDGRVAIIDFYRRPDAMPNNFAMEHIRIDLPEVIREIETAGFALVSQKEHIPGSQYLAIFRKK